MSYGAVAKFLHWSIVILIISQYVIIEAAEELPDGPDKLAGIAHHKSPGMLVLGLALVRIAWKFLNGRNPPPVHMPRAPGRLISSTGGHEFYEEVHETLFAVLASIASIHALAALYHHFLRKDDTLRRMLPFARPHRS